MALQKYLELHVHVYTTTEDLHVIWRKLVYTQCIYLQCIFLYCIMSFLTLTAVLDGSVRLYQLSTTDTYSCVEVYYNGRWGTVCDSMWDVNDGQTACRELGRSASNAEVPAISFFFK